MSDDAYRNGVDAESVCNMVDDIAKCIKGRSSHVKMPVSLDHNGPVICLEFVDADNSYPADLSIRPYKSSGTDAVSTSIASRARFRIRDANLPDNSVNSPSNRQISMDIDDAINKYQGIQYSPSQSRNKHSKSHKSVRSSSSRKSSHSRKSIPQTIEYSDEDDESQSDEMEEIEEELPISRKPSTYIPPGPSASRNIEIKMGTPASRFRVGS